MSGSFSRRASGGVSKRRRLRLHLEQLEARTLLSASSLVMSPLATVLNPQRSINPAVTNPTVVGDTPAQIEARYGLSGVTGTGAGQTIAIVDAYNDPNIASDLAAFDAAFKLATPNLKVVSQTGSTTKLPSNNADWDLEISLDVEWAHAIAPGASILLVEANSASTIDLDAAVDYAKGAGGASVVSMSWGGSEYSGETSDTTFIQSGVTFVASAGDNGSPAIYPSTSPTVVSVGGTTLNATTETAWSDSGGGVSSFEKEPSYQTGVQTNANGNRVSPDVAWDANPNTGVAVYDSINDGYGTGWIQIGGTSVGAPSWSGLFADANQLLVAAGKPVLGANALTDLYHLPSAAYHDITSGGNGTYNAAVGYDAVTGLGSPAANVLIADLVNGVTGSPTNGVITNFGGTTSGGGGGGGHHRGRGSRNGFGGGFQGDAVTNNDMIQTALANVGVVASNPGLPQAIAAEQNVLPAVRLAMTQSVGATSYGGSDSSLLAASDAAISRNAGTREDRATSAAEQLLATHDMSISNGPTALSPEAVDRWLAFLAENGDLSPVVQATAGAVQAETALPRMPEARLETVTVDSTSHVGMSLLAVGVALGSYEGLRPVAVPADRRRWLQRAE